MDYIRVALVTGGSRGIGFEVVKGLCKQLGKNGVVYLTSTSEGREAKALELLEKDGIHPRSHLLNVNAKESILKLRDHIIKEHGGIDILINNAGISDGAEKDIPLSVQAEKCIQTNFFGVLHVTDAFLPYIRDGGRIVNTVSSKAYKVFRGLNSDELTNRFRDASTSQEVVDLMTDFVEAAKRGDHVERGWPDIPLVSYGVSKLGIASLTRVYARQLSGRKDILVNCYQPGFCDTDMVAYYFRDRDKLVTQPISPAEGADTAIYLALLPPGTTGIQGQYLYKRQVYDMFNYDMHELVLN